MDDNTLRLMSGIQIPIPECGLIIHQPSIEDISFIGEQQFFQGVQLLCMQKEDFLKGQKVLKLNEVTTFALFISLLNEKQAILYRELVLEVLKIFFPSYKISIGPRSIIFNQDKQFFNINENNYQFLQQMIKEITCFSETQQDRGEFHTNSKKANEIAEKILAARKKISAQKQEIESKSILSQYLSTLSVGLHFSLTELKKMTIYQIYDLVERYSLYINWDLDIRTRLAGGNPDNQPQNWMKPIH